MLDVFIEIFVRQRTEQPITDAEAELNRFISQVLHPTSAQVERVMRSPPSDIETAVSRVYVELWAHATWDSNFRNETTRVEERLKTAITRLIRTGIENDRFRSVNAELTADHVFFLLKQGIHTRTTTNRDNATERVRTLIDEVIQDISHST